MATTKPTIVFVPGAWSSPAGFDVVRRLLESQGVPTAAVAHPSTGVEPPSQTLSDDVANLRASLEHETGQGREVILVAHSYGGFVASDAAEGYGLAQRKAVNRKGGIIAILYIAAFLGNKGMTITDLAGGSLPPFMQLDGLYCRMIGEADVLFNGLDPQDQETRVSELVHTASAVFRSPISYEPWHTVPCYYLICEGDNAVPPSAQEAIVQTAGKMKTYRCDSSHCPFLSVPEKVVEVLESMIQEQC
ncbi:Alpha/beta hydrolase fold-1 [Aspergillus pseudotamarii]|uniref:Alpha/beta hydrolase fold-1 n=1 Tax=Aspergillus pseudotamarii TaxID=132259 RepID=A0A5N6SXX5_ASPPS|nr:Alpha/beta hydrolase fold-1 [Aspergillus pseudotamarii]KAE8138649.1 Alpha/beta hydrolase fold-1 [Aspergillus pseudotamarii]